MAGFLVAGKHWWQTELSGKVFSLEIEVAQCNRLIMKVKKRLGEAFDDQTVVSRVGNGRFGCVLFSRRSEENGRTRAWKLKKQSQMRKATYTETRRPPRWDAKLRRQCSGFA
jgi:hypothetical protein